jgi:hypothetical protein
VPAAPERREFRARDGCHALSQRVSRPRFKELGVASRRRGPTPAADQDGPCWTQVDVHVLISVRL